MIAEIGHICLLLALAICLAQMFVGFFGARRQDRLLTRIAPGLAIMQFAALSAAFVALLTLFARSDFSVINVVANSHSAKPLMYKLAAAWGNHEGSMLLWVLMLGFFGALVAIFGRNLPERLRALTLSVQSSIGFAFIAFIIFTSNPFARIHPAPPDGQGLNPVLQDPALAIHPPLLYVGYVGFSIVFSFAVAALIEGRVDAAWARWVRPWTLAAWMALTAGIAMGSWWAYYELGWGGWWFWDPVENASFMPWIAGTALLHSALVVEKREALKVWTVLLAILVFSLSLLGTFLVRSGVLTSVHAFAVDPDRGVFILMILSLFIGGSLLLYAWRAPTLTSGGLFAPISREGALVCNNLLLCVACGSVLVGTLYPLALEALTGDKISVGPPYFNMVFIPIMTPLLLLIPIGPLLAWKRGDLVGVTQRLGVVAACSIIIGFAGLWVTRGVDIGVSLGFTLAVWLMLGAVFELGWRVKFLRAPWQETARRLRNLPGSAWGMMLAHAGLGITVLGIVAMSHLRTETITVMSPGQQIPLAGASLRFDGVTNQLGPNYRAEIGHFTWRATSGKTLTLDAEKRHYRVPRQTTSEAGIASMLGGDIYVVMGEAQTNATVTIRAYDNPLVTLIWFGAVVMVFGGLCSLTDRRLRIGKPRAARGSVQRSLATPL